MWEGKFLQARKNNKHGRLCKRSLSLPPSRFTSSLSGAGKQVNFTRCLVFKSWYSHREWEGAESGDAYSSSQMSHCACCLLYRRRRAFRAVRGRRKLSQMFCLFRCCLYGSSLIRRIRIRSLCRLFRRPHWLARSIPAHGVGLQSKMAEDWHALILRSPRRRLCFRQMQWCPSLMIQNAYKLPTSMKKKNQRSIS